VTIISPKTADYAVEVRDTNGVSPPPWNWKPTLTPAVQVRAGRHYTFTLSLQPTYAAESFVISLLYRDAGGTWWIHSSHRFSLTAGLGRGNITVVASMQKAGPDPGTALQ